MLPLTIVVQPFSTHERFYLAIAFNLSEAYRVMVKVCLIELLQKLTAQISQNPLTSSFPHTAIAEN
jgi:hypothetical protein